LPDFKKVIQRIWAALPDDVMRTACNVFEKRLQLLVKAKGQSFENN
jgi:hypothetical protein